MKRIIFVLHKIKKALENGKKRQLILKTDENERTQQRPKADLTNRALGRH